MAIALYCPSRGRPAAARELLDSFNATKSTDQARLIFLLDSDDKTARDYPEPQIIGAPTGDPTGPLNREATKSDAPIVGFIGDDSRFETPGWDEKVLQALRSPGFCWGDDGHEIPWPSTVFVSRRIVDALGWLSLPSLHRGFFDRVWMHLAGGIFDHGWNFPKGHCARILPDVMVRHDNSKGVVPPEVIQSDERAFYEWYRGPAYPADRRKVRSVTELARFFD